MLMQTLMSLPGTEERLELLAASGLVWRLSRLPDCTRTAAMACLSWWGRTGHLKSAGRLKQQYRHDLSSHNTSTTPTQKLCGDTGCCVLSPQGDLQCSAGDSPGKFGNRAVYTENLPDSLGMACEHVGLAGECVDVIEEGAKSNGRGQ